MKTKNTIPKLRHHKASGRAYVVLNGRAIYLGDWGTEESRQNYGKTIAEWTASGKQLEGTDDITINDIKGKVLQVNLIETKIETNNKEIIFIPNSSITKYKVIKSKNGKGIRSNTIRRNRRK